MNHRETKAGLAPTANYQYAQRVGSQLFVAGQVPHDADANLVGIDNPHAQATQCLRNLCTLIDLHGFSQQDIRQLTIYVIGNQQDLAEAWRAVTEWFQGNVPPATLLGIALLGYEHQLVEIDATIISEGILR
ncbi:MAG TPA: RidA family protein [Elainellaceae cyanobacterium]